MNKDYLKKSIGFHVQLRPPATDRDGHILDHDWLIRSVESDRLRIDMIGYGYTVALGLDHVYSFLTNPERDRDGVRFGFLQLHIRLMVSGSSVTIEPLPPPKTPTADSAAHAARFAPLVIEHGGRKRFFSWHGRDPIHLISREEPPRQLGSLSEPLTKALHAVPGHHPRFVLPSKPRGEAVYELSPDFRARWQLLGGDHRGHGDQVLVLMPNL